MDARSERPATGHGSPEAGLGRWSAGSRVGRSLLAVALEDSVQMLVELPPTREPHPFVATLLWQPL